MKNIHEILKEYGMEVPADKKADFDKAWKENYRTKSEYDNAVTQRDNYKASLDDVNTRLKEFEGVDVKDLQGQITKLQGDLKAKDDEYAAKEADRVSRRHLRMSRSLMGICSEQTNQSIIRLVAQVAEVAQIREQMMLLHFELPWDCRKNKK